MHFATHRLKLQTHIGNFQLDFVNFVYASVIIGEEWEGRGGNRPLPQALSAPYSLAVRFCGSFTASFPVEYSLSAHVLKLKSPGE